MVLIISDQVRRGENILESQKSKKILISRTFQ